MGHPWSFGMEHFWRSYTYEKRHNENVLQASTQYGRGVVDEIFSLWITPGFEKKNSNGLSEIVLQLA